MAADEESPRYPQGIKGASVVITKGESKRRKKGRPEETRGGLRATGAALISTAERFSSTTLSPNRPFAYPRLLDMTPGPEAPMDFLRDLYDTDLILSKDR